MSHTPEHKNEVPPRFWAGRPDEHIRKVTDSVRGILEGKTNNHFTITIEAGETSQDISYSTAVPGVKVLLFPQNAAAATFQRTTDLFAVGDYGKVTINHDSSAAGTEVFSLVIVG
jgi:hypothetical protein